MQDVPTDIFINVFWFHVVLGVLSCIAYAYIVCVNPRERAALRPTRQSHIDAEAWLDVFQCLPRSDQDALEIVCRRFREALQMRPSALAVRSIGYAGYKSSFPRTFSATAANGNRITLEWPDADKERIINALRRSYVEHLDVFGSVSKCFIDAVFEASCSLTRLESMFIGMHAFPLDTQSRNATEMRIQAFEQIRRLISRIRSDGRSDFVSGDDESHPDQPMVELLYPICASCGLIHASVNTHRYGWHIRFNNSD